MKISKVRDVKTPERGTLGSAGIDFFVPKGPSYGISPDESVTIPSGIKADIPEGFALIAFNKSGISVKKSLQVGACVVDEDYQGEIHINLHNIGDKPQILRPGDKVIQFLLIPINYARIIVVPENKLYTHKTNRGEGWSGSTGTK